MERLAAAGLWIVAPRAHHSVAQQYIPLITIGSNMAALCNMDECLDLDKFPEVFSQHGIDEYVSAQRGHSADNMTVVFDHMTAVSVGSGPKRSGPKAKNILGEELLAMRAKAQQHMEHAMGLQAHIAIHANVVGRRISAKSPFPALASPVTIEVVYTQHHGARGRRYATPQKTSSQGCSRALLAMACPNVEDWDVRCCMFVLLVQMIDKLNIQLDHPASSFRCVREVANDRKTVSETVLLMQESDGKDLLNAV
eukprot:2965254-Heterocapsa_arctica.AAC.1